MSRFLTTLLLAAATALLPAQTPAPAPTAAPTLLLTTQGNHFLRNGKPHQVLSGAIHYARVPRAYWRDRLRKARAMGLNTVETYVFWNLHEPTPGVFDFSGNLDVAEFVREAQQEGLDVILRPGPYVCAEWEAGGYPGWLFRDTLSTVRSQDPRFLAAVDRYLTRLGKEVGPLQASHGGPIVAIQIENEYGSFGKDKAYMEAIHQSLIRAGLGDSLFYTSDGADQLPNDAFDQFLAVINYGPGEAKTEFAKLQKMNRPFPLMTGEYWDGWFDAWGNKAKVTTDAAKQAQEIAWILAQGYSFNLYMFHGGTSFGFMNGANFNEGSKGRYEPQTTSYDYDAALDEAGRPTPKYHFLRDAIQKHTGIAPPPLPTPIPLAATADIPLTESASLWDNLPAPIRASQPQPMEAYGQSYGYILYRTQLPAAAARTAHLSVGDIRDYAAIYVNRKPAGTLDRRLAQTSLDLSLPASTPVTIDILVENTGRVNFGPHLTDGRAGLIAPVTLDHAPLSDWQVFPLPMESPFTLKGWTTNPVEGPAFHRGTLSLAGAATDKSAPPAKPETKPDPKSPAPKPTPTGNPAAAAAPIPDTFLDTRPLHKGFVWVNGHNLGRTWSIGPQFSLYLPGPWLRAGTNSVVAFDFDTLTTPTLKGSAEPIWATPTKP